MIERNVTKQAFPAAVFTIIHARISKCPTLLRIKEGEDLDHRNKFDAVRTGT
jgi:hypothetical protein